MNNNGKTTIENEINLDALDSAAEELHEEDGVDENVSILMNLQTYCDNNIKELEEEIEALGEEESDEYFSKLYAKEGYELVKNKFFVKASNIEPSMKVEQIVRFINARSARLDKYLEIVKGTVVKGDLDGIEAVHKLESFNTLTDIIEGNTGQSESIEIEIETEETAVELPTTPQDKAKALSDILKKIENGENLKAEEEAEVEAEKSEYEQADIKGKCEILYQKVLEKAEAKDGEPDGSIKSYIEDWYNPADTILDEGNLLLNLLVIDRMQQFEIMDWYFDDTITVSPSDEINLANKWWNDIMTDTSLEEEERITKVVNKVFGFGFYTAMFGSIAANSDKKRYSDNDYKLALALDITDKSKESHFLDILYKHTDEDSLIIVPSDMEQYVNITERYGEELGENAQIKFLGKSEDRIIYSVKTDEIKPLKGFKQGVIYINGGNEFIVNPLKPIVFYNKVENPFLKRPIIHYFSIGDFKFKMDSCSVMFADNLED